MTIDETYEQVKGNRSGWRDIRDIEDKRYLVFIRPDEEAGGTETVFRELLAEKEEAKKTKKR
jgi:hypothetical protein